MIVQLLTIVTFISWGVAYLDDSRKERISISAMNNLDKSIRKMANDVYYEHALMEEYINNSTGKLARILNEYSFPDLQKHFPECYDQAIRVLIEDVINLLTRSDSIPCFQPLNATKLGLVELLNEVIDAVDPIEHHKSQCIQYPHICGIEPTYKKGINLIETVEKKLLELQRWRRIWPLIEECVEETTFQVRRKIYSLRPNNDTCDWVANINIFLREFSIWPLSLGKLVDPEEYWKSFKSMINSINEVNKYISPEDHFEKPDNSVDIHSSCDIQERLFKLSSQLSLNIRRYSDTIRSHMQEMTNNVVDFIPHIFRDNPEMKKLNFSHGKKMPCEDPMSHLIDQVKKLIINHLSKQCFHPLPRLLDNLNRMQVNLLTIESYREREIDRLPSELCTNFTIEIFNVDSTLRVWKLFDLSDTWHFVSDCYDTAFSIIIQNIKRYKPIWEKCRSIPISQGLFSHLPINLKHYPHYESLR